MSRNVSDDDQLRKAASVAAQAASDLADEIDFIIDQSLPSNASRAVRAHLRRVATRLRDLEDALSRELDDLDPDSEIVGHLARAIRRAASIVAAGALFAGGAMATGALESLGADAKNALLDRAAAVEHATSRVESFDPDTGSLKERDTTRLSRLLDAFRSNDVEQIEQQLAFIVRLEGLLREATIEVARSAYGNDWLDVLTSLDKGEPQAWTNKDRSPSTWALGDVIHRIQILSANGNPLPALDGWGQGDTGHALREIVTLRNQVAHGQVAQPGWVQDFLGNGGEATVRNAVELLERLSDR